MNMAATASVSMPEREESASPLLLSPRMLRGPVAASLLLHASVAVILLSWWQASGTNAPQGHLDGLSLTFIELAEPAPAKAATAAHPVAPAAEPLQDILPEPETAPEPVTDAVPLPEPLTAKPERKPVPQPRVSEARPTASQSNNAARTASIAPPDARDGDGQGAAFGLTQTQGDASNEIVITEPRYRAPPRPPVYPRRARDLDQQGVAMVRVKLDLAGNPAEVSILESSGYALLDHAAVKAARGWQFEPERRGGKPVTAFVHIPVRFALN